MFGFIKDFMSEHTIWVALLMVALQFGVLYLIYHFTFKKYRNYLFDKYDYKIDSIFAKLGVLSFLLLLFFGGKGENTLTSLFPFDIDLSWFTDIKEVGFNWETVWAAFLISTPWVIINTIIGLFMTKSLKFTLINIPVLYGYMIIGGFVIIFFGMVAVILGIIGAGASTATEKRRTYTCRNCGHTLAGPGVGCPYCGG